MRTISLNARTSYDAAFSAEEEVILLIFRHEDLPQPLRLSTHPTEILSDDPISWGTRSTWQTPGSEPFVFAMVAALMPSDQQEGIPRARIAFSNVDNRIADLLRSLKTRAICDMAMVLASSPDFIESAYYGLQVVGSEGNSDQVTLSLSREPITSAPFPAGRMTKQRFPGQHR